MYLPFNFAPPIVTSMHSYNNVCMIEIGISTLFGFWLSQNLLREFWCDYGLKEQSRSINCIDCHTTTKDSCYYDTKWYYTYTYFV